MLERPRPSLRAKSRTLPPARIETHSGRQLLVRFEFDLFCPAPRVLLFVQIKRPGQEFDLVAKKIKGDAAGQIREVFKLHHAKWDRRAGSIECNFARETESFGGSATSYK